MSSKNHNIMNPSLLSIEALLSNGLDNDVFMTLKGSLQCAILVEILGDPSPLIHPLI